MRPKDPKMIPCPAAELQDVEASPSAPAFAGLLRRGGRSSPQRSALGSSADGKSEEGIDRSFERAGTPLHLGE